MERIPGRTGLGTDTELVRYYHELDEIQAPRGLFWVSVEIEVEVFGRLAVTAVVTRLQVTNFAGEYVTAGDLPPAERLRWLADLTEAVQRSRRIDLDEVSDRAIADVVERLAAREESRIEDAAWAESVPTR